MAECASEKEPVGNGVKEDTENEDVPMEPEQPEADLETEGVAVVKETTTAAAADESETPAPEKSAEGEEEKSEEKPAEEESSETPTKTDGEKTEKDSKKVEEKEIGTKVAKHYNELQEAGLETRNQSKIFYLRNFNNWVKSIAIADTLEQIRKKRGDDASISVLDLCSGKGGDLLKWKIGRISRLCCADIAATSVKQCEQRYREISDRTRRERSAERVYHAEFIAADCTKKRLKELYRDPSIQFDLTSCQFSFHYCFESYPQADMMLKNACENLRIGGYFIGTTPNAYELVKRLRASEDMSFKNDVYKVTFHSESKDNLPLFGAKYDFQLEGVVDCPEFLVNFPCLEKMAEKYGMQLVHKTSFTDYYKKMLNKEGRALLGRMQSLEPYPPDNDVELMSNKEESYEEAKKRVWQLKVALAEYMEEEEDRNRPIKVGTLSLPEWEAAGLYTVFVFQRTSDPFAPPSESNGEKEDAKGGKSSEAADEEWEVKDEEGGDEEPMEGESSAAAETGEEGADKEAAKEETEKEDAPKAEEEEDSSTRKRKASEEAGADSGEGGEEETSKAAKT